MLLIYQASWLFQTCHIKLLYEFTNYILSQLVAMLEQLTVYSPCNSLHSIDSPCSI